ncbi:MAG: cyclic nucleotide-binding domain-containing protein, partial [Magnetococcales bacterium]|nr:cyclic nucleotide-binding domain-containing protein [Magnetococcales bacterium]
VENAKRNKKNIDELPLFDNFSTSEKLRIAAYFSSIKKFEKGDYIVEKGQRDRTFFIILKGEAIVSIDTNKSPLATITHNDFFGEISYLCDTPRSTHIICKTPCTVLELGDSALSRLGVIIREKFKDMILFKVIDRLDQQNKTLAEFKERDDDRYAEIYVDPSRLKPTPLKDTENNRRVIKSYIKNTPFFEDFSEYEINRLSSVFTHIRKIPPHYPLIQQGTRGKVFFVLLSGEVAVVKGEGRKKVLLATLKKSSVFGEVSFLTNEPRTTHIIASKDCVVLMINQNLMTFMGAETREKYKDAVLKILLTRLEGQNAIIQKYKSSVYFN